MARPTRNASQDDAPTSDRLRAAIDAGEAEDKQPASDPAAAPLGTDDEAAGTPPTPEQRRRAAAAETGRDAPETDVPGLARAPERPRSHRIARAVILVVLLLGTIAVVSVLTIR